MAEEEPQQAQNVPTEPTENISRAESEEVRLPDSAREHETVWHRTLKQLQADLPASDAGEAETRLKGTTLLQVTETAARIRVPSAFAIAWLERRMYGQIAKAMKGVLGKDLDLHFVAAS